MKSVSRALWYPRANELLGFAPALATATRQALEAGDGARKIAEGHNAYVNYVLSMLFFATAHRPVADPLCYPWQIDPEVRLCLINDKVVVQNRAYRLSALAARAAKQYLAYRAHLEALEGRIFIAAGGAHAPSISAVCADIKNLYEEVKGQIKLPLFFYLSPDLTRTRSVKPLGMSRSWRPHWSAPMNIGRRVLATELISRGVASEQVMMQLGHVDALEHPFGELSTHVPIDEFRELGGVIEDVLASLGWDVVKGFQPLRVRTQAPKTKAGRGATRVHRSRQLGPLVREKHRKERLAKCRALVEEAIHAEFGANTPQAISSTDVEELSSRVRLLANERSVSTATCVRMLYTWLLRQTSSVLANGERLRFQLVLEPEASPFHARTLSDYRRVREARDAFLRRLDERGRQASGKVSIELRLAELIVGAALEDGVTHPGGYRGMVDALLNTAYALDGLVFLDLEEVGSSPPGDSYRWYPSYLNQALLTGLYQLDLEANRKNIDRSRLRRNLLAELRGIDATVGKTTGIDSMLNALVRSSRAIESSGMVRSIATRRLRYRTLPATAMVRMVKRKRLDESSQPNKANASTESDLATHWIARRPASTTTGVKLTGEDFQCAYREIRIRLQATPPTGRARYKTQLKKALSREVKALVDDKPWTERVHLLAGWIVELCERGTRHKRDLAYKTVEDYSIAVARPLLELDGESFLDFSDVEYEDFYLEALNFRTTPNGRRFLAGRLLEFHAYLLDVFCVEEPDWAAVFQGAGGSAATPINANVVWPWEYEAALATVLDDGAHHPRRRDQFAFALICGYRWGLRFGEAFRLQWRNMQYTANLAECWLKVRNNIYGTTKREPSVRQVPLTGTLLKMEKGVIERMIEACRAEAGEPQVAFMHEEGRPRSLIARAEAGGYLNLVLKGVTGDATVRFHHLRHSWATRQSAAAFPKGDSEGPWGKIRAAITADGRYAGGEEALWGEMAADTRALRAISVGIGHASEATTVSSYIHIIDAYAACLPSRESRLSDFVLSYATQVQSSAIRKRRSRGEGRAADIMLVRPTRRQRSLPAPDMPVTEQAWAPPEAQSDRAPELSLLTIERVLAVAGYRQGNTTGVAEALHITEAELKQILEAADRLERKSGFEHYRAALWSSELLIQGMKSQIDPPERKDSGTLRLREWLADLTLQLGKLSPEALSEVKAGLDAWISAFLPSHRAPRFSSLADAERYMRAISLLGYELKWTAKCRPEIETQLREWASRHAVEVQLRQSGTRPTAKAPRERLIWFLLVPSKLPVPMKTLGTLNAGLFILAVKLRMTPAAIRVIIDSNADRYK